MDSKSNIVSLSEVMKDVFGEIEHSYKRYRGLSGLSTGYRSLDNLIMGMQQGEFIVIGGRPSMGKTSLALNLARNVASIPGKTVVYFSLEMSNQMLTKRILFSEAMVDITKLNTGELTNDEWEKVVEGAKKADELKILIDDTVGISAEEIYSKCCELNEKYDISMVIVDYMQLLSGDLHGESRQKEVEVITRTLKTLAKEMNMPVLLLSQLSKAIDERSDHHPMLSDLRELAAVVQDADLVMFIYRDSYYNKDSAKGNIAEVIIAKNKNGKCGTVELFWQPEIASFFDSSMLMAYRTISENDIIKVVCEKYGISENDVRSKKRNSEVVLPRQVIMYLCRKLTDMPLETIGAAVGKKDHTSVMSGIHKIKDLVKVDKQLEETITCIESELKAIKV